MDIFLDLFKNKNSTIMIIAIPSVRMWIDHIQAYYILFLALGVFFTLITITLAAVHLYFVYRYISHESIQSDLYWLVYMCPVSWLFSLLFSMSLNESRAKKETRGWVLK